MNRRKTIFSICLLLIAVIFTYIVKNIDLAPIGPNGSMIGLSTFNGKVHDLVGVNTIWYDITLYLGFIPFLWVLYYFINGLLQLIKEKSLFKVDKKIIALGFFYVVVGLVYVFFEKFIINYRPTLINGELEASYPSSHTLFAITLCGSAILFSKYYIKNEKVRNALNIITYLLMLTVIAGRIASGFHWASDIIGGILISSFLLSSLSTSLDYLEKKEEIKE